MDNNKKHFFLVVAISFILPHNIKSSNPKRIHVDPATEMIQPFFQNSSTNLPGSILQNPFHQIAQSDKKHVLIFIKKQLTKTNCRILPEDILNLCLDEEILYAADSLEQIIIQLNGTTTNIQEQLEIIATHFKQP